MNPIPFNSREEDTPESRIAAVVSGLNERYRIKFPNRRYGPDFADYREEVRPYLEIELLEVQLKTMMMYGSYRESIAVRNEINDKRMALAKRELQT